MRRLTLFCVITVAFLGLTSGAGVLPEDSVKAAAGDSVMFTTSLAPTENPLDSISWDFGNTNIVNSVAGGISIAPAYRDRITLFVLTGSLELRNVALSDTGEYSVEIRQTASGDSTLNGTTILNVDEPVSDVRLTANSTDLVEFNSSVSLSCLASGSSLSFRWFNGSVQVTDGDRVHFTDGGAILTIVTVWRYDHGSYRCEVSNPVSNPVISNEEPLFVNYGPENVTLTPPPSDEYWEGFVVPFSCSADSRPDAQFTWFLNGEMLSSTGAQINLMINQSGNYICQAFNRKTLRYATSQPAMITVLQKIKNVSVELSSSHAVEGMSVNLTCDASGFNRTREWMSNGTVLEPSENIEFYDQRRVLSFRNLTRKDNGNYICNISNPVSYQTVDYEMNVNYGPDSVHILGSVEVQEGSTLKLTCLADSVPTANYIWTKNGTALTQPQSDEYTIDNIRVSDSGEYICLATNDITNKSLETSRTVNVTGKAAPNNNNGCSTGCIVGIVVGCIAVILLVSGGVFYALKKKKQNRKSNTRTGGEGQDNSAYAQNQEVNYADVRFVKKDGAVVQLGAQQNNTEYAEVRKNNNPPASHLPSYNAHMQRTRRAAPEPPTEYADVRRK